MRNFFNVGMSLLVHSNPAQLTAILVKSSVLWFKTGFWLAHVTVKREKLWHMMVCGGRVTGFLVCCICRYLISQHPKVEAMVVSELDQAGLLVSRARPNPREIEYDDISRLPYLNACLQVKCKFWPSYILLKFYPLAGCVIAPQTPALHSGSHSKCLMIASVLHCSVLHCSC